MPGKESEMMMKRSHLSLVVKSGSWVCGWEIHFWLRQHIICTKKSVILKNDLLSDTNSLHWQNGYWQEVGAHHRSLRSRWLISTPFLGDQTLHLWRWNLHKKALQRVSEERFQRFIDCTACKKLSCDAWWRNKVIFPLLQTTLLHFFSFLYKWVLQWKTKCSYYNLMNYIAGICFLLLTRCKCAEIHVPFFKMNKTCVYTHSTNIFTNHVGSVQLYLVCCHTCDLDNEEA